MFQSRVMGVGSQRPGDPQFGPPRVSDAALEQMFKLTGGGPITKKILTPEEIAQQDAIIEKNRSAQVAEDKRIQDIIEAAKKWRSTSPIASVKTVRSDGSIVTLDVYGYNKESGLVWIKDPVSGQIGLGSESNFKNSPEWVAAKASLGKSSGGFSLPLLLGAAYLLLS